MRKASSQRKTRQETLAQVYEYISGVGVAVSMTEVGRGIEPPIGRSSYLKGILDELVEGGWLKRVWHDWTPEIKGWLYYCDCFVVSGDDELQLSMFEGEEW